MQIQTPPKNKNQHVPKNTDYKEGKKIILYNIMLDDFDVFIFGDFYFNEDEAKDKDGVRCSTH